MAMVRWRTWHRTRRRRHRLLRSARHHAARRPGASLEFFEVLTPIRQSTIHDWMAVPANGSIVVRGSRMEPENVAPPH